MVESKLKDRDLGEDRVKLFRLLMQIMTTQSNPISKDCRPLLVLLSGMQIGCIVFGLICDNISWLHRSVDGCFDWRLLYPCYAGEALLLGACKQ